MKLLLLCFYVIWASRDAHAVSCGTIGKRRVGITPIPQPLQAEPLQAESLVSGGVSLSRLRQ